MRRTRLPLTAHRAWVVLASLALAVATSVIAPGVALGDERYEALFREGRARMDAQDYDKACSLFKDSLDLGAPVGALLNLAACEDKRGHVARSLSLWKEGLAQLPADDPRRDLAQRQIGDVDRRVGKIAVVWAKAPPDAKGFVDGHAITLGGDPEPVDPGTHKITIASSSGSSATDVAVNAGELKTVDASPGHREPEQKGKGLVIGGAISLGIGGLAATGAVISGAVYLNARATVDSRCPDRSHCNDATALAARDRALTAGAANVAMFVIAGVGAGIGVPLLIVNAEASSGDVRAPRITSELRIGPTGASWLGTF